VLVTDAAGHLVKTRAAAAGEPVLRLQFVDGTLDVATGEGPAASPAAVPRRTGCRTGAAADTGNQPKLL
jgi:exodeoxyribonuclease VII large subunit